MNALWTVLSTLLLLNAASAGVYGWWRAWAMTRMSRLETVGVWLSGGPAVVCLAGILLADGGCFSLLSLWLVVALLLVGAVGVWRWRRPSGDSVGDAAPPVPAEACGETWPWTSRTWSACVVLGVLLAALPVLRPYTHLHGGWDPGEYVCTAANLARTGALRVQDPFFAAQDAPVRRMLMAEPDGNRRLLHSGYLVQDEATGLLTPDFFHLYPVWLATFATVGGVHGAYWGQWVITILALAMFVLLLKTLFSARVAVIGLLLLAAGPGQVYFGRFTSAEMLTRFFLFGAFFWLASTLRQPAWRRDLAAGVLCGLAFLVHSTSVIPLAGAALFLSGHALWTGRLSSLRTLLVVAVGGLLALLRNAMQTPVMTEFLFGFISRHPFLLLPAAGLAAAALAGLVVAVRLRGRRRRAWVLPPLAARVARMVPGVAVVAFLVYQGAIRPFDPAGGWERLNMILAGRMAGPLTVVLAGVFFCRRRWTRWSGGEALFWFAGGLTAAVLIQYRMAYPLVMWSLRRYMPLVVPLLVAAGAVVLVDMASSASRRVRWAAMALLLVTLGGLGWESWPMLRVREHRGLPAFTGRLAEAMAGADFILCDSIRYATPLRYAWGLPAYQFARQQDAVDTGEAAAAADLLAVRVATGQRVYYLTVSEGFAHPAFQLVPEGRFDQISEVLRMRLPTLPRTVLPAPNRARLFRCVPPGSEALNAPASRANRPGVATPITTGYHSLGLVSGFGKVNRQSTPAFRWTDGTGVLYVPSPGSEGGVLELMLASGRAKQPAPVAVDIVLDGQRLGTLAVGREWTRHRIPVPPMTAALACCLEVRSEVWNPADVGISGYPANLGIRVASVQMLPHGEGE